MSYARENINERSIRSNVKPARGWLTASQRSRLERKFVFVRCVLLAIECGSDTLQKIRKVTGDARMDEIKDAVRILKKERLIEQVGRRYRRVSN